MSGDEGKQRRRHTSEMAPVLKHCVAFRVIKATVGGYKCYIFQLYAEREALAL